MKFLNNLRLIKNKDSKYGEAESLIKHCLLLNVWISIGNKAAGVHFVEVVF